ncbi:hypothetical protein BCR33DRAFT_717676 [Rhizoclosmatium globosum]|uniref:Uncharacterized protein n=1 Tax=Rhizoclosmatium globosum TaxID=329046 RepID=A0A1Y2C8W6_9FUNG|nr:hypothetical protein BCR33DRAFT_717676 [Rhizoclosmatium globosum]|eukprot:ORY43472.1 hypothetical protein BCR33DRAFT_717676 [Rhizoclosmatium globosum]
MSSNFLAALSTFDDIGATLNNDRETSDLMSGDALLEALAKKEAAESEAAAIAGDSLSAAIGKDLGVAFDTGIGSSTSVTTTSYTNSVTTGITTPTTSGSQPRGIPSAATYASSITGSPVSPADPTSPHKDSKLFGFLAHAQRRQSNASDVSFNAPGSVLLRSFSRKSPAPTASDPVKETPPPVPAISLTPSLRKPPSLFRSKSKDEVRISSESIDPIRITASPTPTPQHTISERMESVTTAFSSFVNKVRPQRTESLNPPQTPTPSSTTTTTTTTPSPAQTAASKTIDTVSTAFSSFVNKVRPQRSESLQPPPTPTPQQQDTTTTTTTSPTTQTTSPSLPRSSSRAATLLRSHKDLPVPPSDLTLDEIDETLDKLRSPSLKRKITRKKSTASMKSVASSAAVVVPSLGEVALDMFRQASMKRPGPRSKSGREGDDGGEGGDVEGGVSWWMSPGTVEKDKK